MSTNEERGVLSRFGSVILRSPRYLLLGGNLARDDRLSPAQKGAAVACLGYAVSPIDLMPGIIPVAGQLDDLTVLIGGLRTLIRTIPPPIGEEHLNRAGLTTQTMDDDLRTVRDTAWWLARKGAALLGRLTRSALDGAASRFRREPGPVDAKRMPASAGRHDLPG